MSILSLYIYIYALSMSCSHCSGFIVIINFDRRTDDLNDNDKQERRSTVDRKISFGPFCLCPASLSPVLYLVGLDGLSM